MNERKDETQSIYTIGSSRQNLVAIRSRHAYLKKRRRVPILIVIILFVLMAVSATAALAFAILYVTNRPAKLCETESCVRIAASLKESMDTSVDPCDDFYEYACGKWSDEHPIPDKSLTNSWFEERRERVYRKIRELLRDNETIGDAPWAVKQAKILFNSCMDAHATNQLGLTPLFQLLEQLHLSPIPAAFTNTSNSASTNSYVEQIAMVKRVLGKDVFFGFDVIPDPRNTSNNVMLFDTPITSSPLPNDKELEKRLRSIRSRFRKLDEQQKEQEEEEEEEEEEGEEEEEEEVDGESTSELKAAETRYMSEVIKRIVNNGSVDSCSLNESSSFPGEERLQDVVETLYQLTSIFYYLSRSESNRSIWEDDPTYSDYMLVDDLQEATDQFVREANSSLEPRPLWRPFIELLFNGIDALDLDGKDKVLVADLEYLKEVALVLALAEDQQLETYVWWVIIDIVVPHSSEDLRKVWLDYVDRVISVEIGESRSLLCASAVNELMGMAVSWLFVDPSFHRSQGRKVSEMMDDIKEAFASLVLRTDWMDEQTKLATLEKNRKMESQIGFPTWLFDQRLLNEYYEGIDLSETEYLSNTVQIVRLMSLSELECIHRINYDNLSYWATDPTDVNAFHTYQFNHITIPAGILQFPFYELGLESLNYGAIGAVLGHELTHGFDNSGRHYDSDGNVRQWWSNQTISRYIEKAECFVDHYSSYYEAEVDDYIDGELTLGENIADNGGLREAVIAYERWKARHGEEPLLPGFAHLTAQQLLFLGFAHVWCESYTAKSLRWILQDSHCPGHVRLLGVLRNSKEFSEAWKCPAGSNMNPSSKCRLW